MKYNYHYYITYYVQPKNSGLVIGNTQVNTVNKLNSFDEIISAKAAIAENINTNDGTNYNASMIFIINVIELKE